MSGHTIISIDNKQNIRTWLLNNGCIEQLTNQQLTLDPLNPSTPPISLERCPNFINKAFLFDKDNTLWSVTSAEGNVSLEDYSNQGTNWSQRQAVYNQQKQSVQMTTRSGLRKSINLGPYILLLFQDKTMEVWDTITRAFITPTNLKALSVSNWQLHSAGLLLWTKDTIYRLDTQLTLTTLITANSLTDENDNYDMEVITAARADSSGISFVTRAGNTYIPTRGKNKGKATLKAIDTCNIYKANTNGSGCQRVDSRTLSADVSGIYHNNNIILYWIYRANQPLEMYWYNNAQQHTGPSHSICVPKHQLLQHAPHSFCRLPKEEGFTFESSDNDRRWVLKFDFPLIEEDTVPPVRKELLLDFHPDWEYASTHLLNMLPAFRSKPSALPNVYAEASPFGVVVHYRTTEGNGRLLWTGSSIRNFAVIATEALVLSTPTLVV